MNCEFVLENIPVEQTTTNSQLENSTNMPKLTDLENSTNSKVCILSKIIRYYNYYLSNFWSKLVVLVNFKYLILGKNHSF